MKKERKEQEIVSYVFRRLESWDGKGSTSQEELLNVGVSALPFTVKFHGAHSFLRSHQKKNDEEKERRTELSDSTSLPKGRRRQSSEEQWRVGSIEVTG